jgi:hypothetical protein
VRLVDSHLTRAKILILLKEFDEAKQSLEQAIEDGDRSQQKLVNKLDVNVFL